MADFLVSDYGTVTWGTGRSTPERVANKLALAAACDAACAAAPSRVVIDEEDTLEVHVDPLTDQRSKDSAGTIATAGYLKAAGSVTLTGLVEDSLTSRIAFFPNEPDFDYALFYIDEYLGTQNVTVADLTIAGPVSFGLDDPRDFYTRYAFQHDGGTSGHHARSYLTFRNVVIDGKFDGCFNSNSGDVTISMTEVDFSSVITAINVYNQNSCDKRLNINDSTFHGQYVDETAGVGLYVHPNIELNITNSHFEDTSRYAIYGNDSGGASLPVPPPWVSSSRRTAWSTRSSPGAPRRSRRRTPRWPHSGPPRSSTATSPAASRATRGCQPGVR